MAKRKGEEEAEISIVSGGARGQYGETPVYEGLPRSKQGKYHQATSEMKNSTDDSHGADPKHLDSGNDAEAGVQQSSGQRQEPAFNPPSTPSVPSTHSGSVTVTARALHKPRFLTSERIRLYAQNEPKPTGRLQRGVFLGAGSYGIAHGYVVLDSEGQALDHFVVKDVYYQTSHWTDSTLWHGDFRDPTRKPIEIAILEKLWHPSSDRSSHCLRLRSSDVQPQHLRYRLITDYCHYGDLGGILSHYQELETRIPEPAIWSIIDGLSKACYSMAYGTSNLGDCRPGSEWQQVIHRDIKLENIYLARQREGAEFPAYPAAVLGDWGLSVITSQHDHNNPAAYLDRGTDGWMPPEQVSWLNTSNTLPHLLPRLGEQSNVWAVGAVAIRLMNLREMNSYEHPEDSSHLHLGDLRVEDDARALYSPALVSIAESCCVWRIGDRPTTAQLVQYIRSHTEGALDSASGLRTKDAGDVAPRHRLMLIGDKVTDKFVRPQAEKNGKGTA